MPLASLVHDRFVAALAQGLVETDWPARSEVEWAGIRTLGPEEKERRGRPGGGTAPSMAMK
jgi:hypothetical protein